MADLWIRLAAVAALLAAATVAWLLVQRRRAPRSVRHSSGLARIAAAVSVPSGPEGVVVQFSGPYCSACGPSARLWRTVVGPEAFVELDVSEHLELVRTFGVLSTPTSLVFDGDGTLRARVSGAPSPRRAREALALATG
ncbi:thioredoxin family protein [Ruania suaedae]|uniref:thioredoxin family protein n=1 Tax=Ruania suaedae TaxID=2897774 RepID=UPI001E460749|nr:thioredoxin family protein [Ruania suaedae]UFU04499.1 thioredoxin family protein [Ruania suaedae]